MTSTSSRQAPVRQLTAEEKRLARNIDWLYCTRCGKHWAGMHALGQWIGTHTECGGQVAPCLQADKCYQLRKQLVEES